MLTYLLLVLGVVVIAGFVWHFRRQAAAREAASAERMKAFLEQARAEAAARQSDATKPATAAPLRASPAATAKPARVAAAALLSGFTLRAPMLDAQQLALYQLLKQVLHDHEILGCVSLATFMQCAENVTGFAREAQERRLADAVADFVVCDREMNPLVAVQCGARNGKAAEKAAFAAACAAATGVRWVEISSQALPQPEALRQQVLGA